jgi:hypothetical protein
VDNDVSTAHKILHVVINNWQYFLALLGGVLGTIWWGLKKVFPTHETMAQCKMDLVLILEKHTREEKIRSLELKREMSTQLQEVRSDLRQIVDHLIEGK